MQRGYFELLGRSGTRNEIRNSAYKQKLPFLSVHNTLLARNSLKKSTIRLFVRPSFNFAVDSLVSALNSPNEPHFVLVFFRIFNRSKSTESIKEVVVNLFFFFFWFFSKKRKTIYSLIKSRRSEAEVIEGWGENQGDSKRNKKIG